jgi:hypothetical protein
VSARHPYWEAAPLPSPRFVVREQAGWSILNGNGERGRLGRTLYIADRWNMGRVVHWDHPGSSMTIADRRKRIQRRAAQLEREYGTTALSLSAPSTRSASAPLR